MARLVNTTVDVKKGFTIVNHYKSGNSSANTFYIGDVIENMSFAENNEMTTITGRITDVGFRYFRYATIANAKASNSLKKDAKVTTISLDASKEFESNVYDVNAMSVLEYEPTEEVVKVTVEPDMHVHIKATLSDGSATEETVYEGMTLFNVTILRGGKEVTGNFVVSSFIYKVPKMKPEIVGFFLVNPDISYKVYFESIKYIGKEGTVVEEGDDLAKAFAENAEVEIYGVTFTGNSKLDVTLAKSVRIKNCKFVGVTPQQTKDYLIQNRTFGDRVCLIQIEDSYFGSNPNNESNKMYNLFELNTKLANGSCFNNNYFKKEACTHNIINLYDVANGAKIDVEYNVFEYSANAVRVGFINAPSDVTLTLQSNTYYETDTDPDWAGILLIQPYANRTETLYGVRININNTTYTGDVNTQLWYQYCGSTDTQLVPDTSPRVYVNGTNESGNEPSYDPDDGHKPADGSIEPDDDGHYDWYERCNSTTPYALLVVSDTIDHTSYVPEIMIKRSLVLADIPDIQIGEYVIYREGIDSL